MNRMALAILAVLYAEIAVAQTGANSVTLWSGTPTLECTNCSPKDYGSDDVGRAMAICAQQEIPSNAVYAIGCATVTGACPPSVVPGDYPDEWRACYKVRAKWNAGAVAKRARERAEQIERDRQFVQSVAETQQ